MTAAPQRILLIQLHHLGDVLLTTPAIHALRQEYPHARVDFLTNTLGAQALHGNRHLDNILVKPKLLDVFRARYDAVVDMHSVPRTARVVAASRARLRVGLRGRGPRNLAYNRLLPREKNAVYMALQKMRVLAPLNVPPTYDLSLDLVIGDEDRITTARQWKALGLLDEPVVAISPVAKHDFKQWGYANWAAVADALAASGARILITSGPGEREQARAVAQAMKGPAVWDFAPGTIQQLGAMYARCVLWLGNDGGPKHIATAARTPTITVYRKQLGAVWSDPNDPNQVAINSGAETPEGVAPARVMEAAEQLLARLR
jgi:ADP-heptose:LPS heptosyltransferase